MSRLMLRTLAIAARDKPLHIDQYAAQIPYVMEFTLMVFRALVRFFLEVNNYSSFLQSSKGMLHVDTLFNLKTRRRMWMV